MALTLAQVHTTFFLQHAILYLIFMPTWGMADGQGIGMHMWASHSAHIYNLLPHDWASPLTGWTPYLWVELSLFAYIFGRVVEETQQVHPQPRLLRCR